MPIEALESLQPARLPPQGSTCCLLPLLSNPPGLLITGISTKRADDKGKERSQIFPQQQASAVLWLALTDKHVCCLAAQLLSALSN
jgi:hypothetical protein